MRVLHVDDENDIREVAALSLQIDPAVDVQSAASGRAALDILEAGSRPDVILLDVMMPMMDGPTTLSQLRDLPDHKTTPVIFMTARARDQELEKFLELGAIGVIVKPFDPLTLAQQVRDILNSRR